MFDTIRNHQKILQFILLVLILPAFVFFGVSSYSRNNTKEETVAEVGGQKITKQEYDRALSAQLAQMRQMFGGQIDPSVLDTPEMRKNVLATLVTQKTLQADAHAQRLSGSLAQVEAIIRSNPGLSKPDGTIDIQQLKEILGRQGKSLEGFQQEMQRDLGAQLKPDAIGNTAFTPTSVAEQLVKLAEEVREVRELKVLAKDFEAKVTPTADQLKAYYDGHASQFKIAESAKIEYVVFSAEAFSKQVTLNPEEVKTFYEQNKARFGTKEERQASHILIKLDAGKDAAKTKAAALLDQVRKDPSKFAEVAKANSQDPGSGAQGGDLGFFQRESMVKPFADAAFALKQGEISDLVESEFGFHIIRLTAVKPEAIRPFAEVKAELEADLLKQQAQKKFSESAQQFTDLVYEQAESFKPVVEKFKLTTQVLDALPRNGLPKGQSDASSIFASPKLLAAVFSEESIKRKRNTDAVEISPGLLVSARILDYTPAKTKPQDAVTAELTAAVKLQEAMRLAKEAGEARLKAAASDAGFGATQSLTRSGQVKLPAPAVEAIYRAPRAKLPVTVGVELPSEGYALYQIVAVKAGEGDEVAKRREQALAQLGRSSAGVELFSFINALKARYPATMTALNPAQVAPVK
jgi:peptidyl-prolyl cis-trans isomerase D